MSLTPEQREIAAQIMERKGFSLGPDTTPDEVEAAAFVFDHGLLMKPASMHAEIIKMLRSASPKTEESRDYE
jgi:hypothetical protein